MRYDSIADIYSANHVFREKFGAALTHFSPTEAVAVPEGEKWSIQHIAEHVSMVDYGISRICAKLLDAAKAEGKESDGTFALSANFAEHAAESAVRKLEAPERVQPTGDVTIADAWDRIIANREIYDAMREDFERFDLSGPTFPHPYFGPLNAGEWLVMTGLHQARHTKQMNDLAEKLRQ